MKVVGLFSGVGGIELGFEQAGFEVIWGNEIDKNAAKTYKLNHSSKLVVGDIQDIKSEDIPDTDIIVGGFPCQAFSIAGYRKGFEDERGNIFFSLARVIRDKRPKAILLENVRNLIGHDGGKTYETIKETLESYGYHIDYMILNASEYGNIPQNRERIYILGFLDKSQLDKFKKPHRIKLTKTIMDIVDQSIKVDDRYYYSEGKYKNVDKVIKEVVKRNTLYQWRRVYVRENKSNLCPTLTANMGTGGHNVPLVLTDYGVRKLTPRECFMFQGYPEDFKLPEDMAISHLYKQAGNSVVVPVIKRIAENIKLAME